MKRLILSLLVLLTFSAVFSQRLFFVYLQTEPEQPFFIKVNDKIHSSTASGYLILSRLRDSSYAITVGFPQNKWPEQKFTIDMRSRDHGYSLKNFGEKGWGLFDMESMTIQMASNANTSSGVKTEPKDVSVFTDILSKAANDPSLKEKPVVPREEKPVVVKEEKPVVSAPVTKEETNTLKDSMIAKRDEPVVKKEEIPVSKDTDSMPVIKVQPPVTSEEKKDSLVPEYKRSTVTKRSESSNSDGLHITFIDNYGNGKRDTVRIIIPNQKTNLPEIKEPAKEEKRFLDIPATDSVKIDTVKKIEPEEKPIKSETSPVTVVQKNTCTSTATESDFLKIRKNMAAETNDDAMIAAAKKQFKARCFSSLQVKNLSALFLNDSGKYKFFDAAYEYVSDKENFPALVSELKDEYYINRFKAMLR